MRTTFIDLHSALPPSIVFNALAITLRELAELLLIAEALLLCLRQNGRPALIRHVMAGMLGGVLLGGLLALWVAHRELDPTLAAAITVAFSLAVVLLTSGMLSSARLIRNRIESFIESRVNSPWGPFLVAGFALIVGLRESVEIGLFLEAIGEASGATEAATGAALGVLSAAALVAVYRTIKARVKLLVLFGVSTLLMSLLSIQLLIAGLGELLHAQLQTDSSWLDASAPFLEGGALYPWFCALLMAPPLLALARRWWYEAGTAG